MATNLLTNSENSVVRKIGYRVGEVVGEGAYAKVVRAEFTGRGGAEAFSLPLACKVIDKRHAPAEFVKKFLPRELEILARLDHPHIIHVHSIFQKNAKYFLFMRLAEGGDLLNYVLTKGELSEGHARLWFRQAALALQYLHVMDLCHRDLKLENLLITSNMNIKLGDFGFARSTVDFRGNSVLSETYCGSLSYAAPEVIKGTPYDPKMSDVWSLGCVLFAMLNQRMPFEDNTMPRLYELQMNRRVKYRSNVLARLGSAVKLLLYHMLEPAVSKRHDIHAVLLSDWFADIQMSEPERLALESALENKRKAAEAAKLASMARVLNPPRPAGKEDTRQALIVIKQMDPRAGMESVANEEVMRAAMEEPENVTPVKAARHSVPTAPARPAAPTVPRR